LTVAACEFSLAPYLPFQDVHMAHNSRHESEVILDPAQLDPHRIRLEGTDISTRSLASGLAQQSSDGTLAPAALPPRRFEEGLPAIMGLAPALDRVRRRFAVGLERDDGAGAHFDFEYERPQFLPE
jgi:hypothetical protein